jgi:pilus assembly protein Flp/PilA
VWWAATTTHELSRCHLQKQGWPLWSPREAENAMKSLLKKVHRFVVSEDGPTAVEYAVMLALIIIICLTAIRSIGTNANATFETVGTELG